MFSAKQVMGMMEWMDDLGIGLDSTCVVKDVGCIIKDARRVGMTLGALG